MRGRSQDKRWWFGGGAALGVVILVVGWFAAVHPELSEASATRVQTAAAAAQNVALQAKNGTLKEQNDDAGALRAGLSAALDQLPSDGGLPAFTRQLSAQATAASVRLTSVVVGGATPVVATTAAPQTASSAPETTAASSAPATTTAPAGAATSPSGLVQMTITVVASGLGRQNLAFLRAIQWTGPRRALVTAVQLVPSGSAAATGIDGTSTMTLTLTIFSAPLSPTAQAALEKLLSGK